MLNYLFLCFQRYEMTGGGARQRAMQAVDYYNSNVLKARIHAGLTTDRPGAAHHPPYHTRHTLTQDQMYRWVTRWMAGD